MRDFRWFRLLLFALGLFFVGISISSVLHYVVWIVQQFVNYSGSNMPRPGTDVVIAGVLSAIPYVLQCALGMYLMLGGGRLSKWILQRIQHNCMQCDYPLTGVTAPRCPECGLEFSRSTDAVKIENPGVS
jgi:hypothetical protein